MNSAGYLARPGGGRGSRLESYKWLCEKPYLPRRSGGVCVMSARAIVTSFAAALLVTACGDLPKLNLATQPEVEQPIVPSPTANSPQTQPINPSTSSAALSPAPRQTDGSIREVVMSPLYGLQKTKVQKEMNIRDTNYAQDAEKKAFENLDNGRLEPTSWDNPDSGHSGDVTIGSAFRNGNLDCRNYIHIVRLQDHEIKVAAKACRDSTGHWSTLG
jgi:surface antigen